MNLQSKFQCHYRLTIQYEENGEVFLAEVRDPITINFNVSKATLSDVNTATIVIYNLDAVTRQRIYQDRILLDQSKRHVLTLEAGYGDNLTLICLGFIQQCYSERNGTDFVTTIDVLDPDILTEYTSVTFEAGTTFDEAYKYLAAQFPHLKQGECGRFDVEFKTPTVFDGNSFCVINELTGGHTFIENGFLHTLNDNETLQGYKALLISADTGLLGTPKRYDAILEVSMIFEPTIRVGQLVEIKSETWAGFDGQYKVLGYSHNCVISGAVGGSRITTLQLQYIRYLTDSNVNLTNNPQGSEPVKIVNNKPQPIFGKISAQAKEIYKYIKQHNGQVPNVRITNRISWKNVIYPIGSKNQPQNVKASITEGYLENCRQIAINLTEVLDQYFPYNKISISSGYRTPQNNMNTERSALNSNHLTGSAIDFSLDGVPFTKLVNVFNNKNIWRLGLGIYYNKRDQFLHVSLNPKERFIGSR